MIAAKSWAAFVKRNFGLLLTGISAVTLLLSFLYMKFVLSLKEPLPAANSIEEFHQQANSPINNLLERVVYIFSISFFLLTLGVTITIIQLALRWIRRPRT